MFLQELQLQQFRCFEDKKIRFNNRVTVLIGDNGAGKTSIVEAIYYLSYFKSFRSHTISELMHSGTDSFFLKGQFLGHDAGQQHTIQVGYSQKKKSIRFDQKQVTSYKDLLSLFQVVTLTEDDVDLIKGSPSGRRAFIDQAVLLAMPEMLQIYREFRQVLQHRNAFLDQHYGKFDPLEYEIWTQKLWAVSVKIAQKRVESMGKIQSLVNELIEQYFGGIYEITISYEAKTMQFGQDFGQFMGELQSVTAQERALKRSMFGAHLDDLVFQIRGKKARIYASRGQQKLIALLCKLSLTMMGSDDRVKPIFLMDDFISDFDTLRLKNLTTLFSTCNNQIIITAPFFDLKLKELLENADPEVIRVGL